MHQNPQSKNLQQNQIPSLFPLVHHTAPILRIARILHVADPEAGDVVYHIALILHVVEAGVEDEVYQDLSIVGGAEDSCYITTSNLYQN
jgi:hypothetical protein